MEKTGNKLRESYAMKDAFELRQQLNSVQFDLIEQSVTTSTAAIDYND